MEENPYKAPSQDDAPTVPLGGCLEAARAFAVGLVIPLVLAVIAVAICVGTFYSMRFFSED